MRGGSLEHVLTFAKAKVAEVVQPGEVVVDATLGNGHDMVHLAQCVGPAGHVYGFDVQAQALEATRHRLQTQCPDVPVTLVEAGHETMGEVLSELAGQVAAVMFNLGYLPGGDKSRTTRPETTLAALDQAMQLLRAQGILSIVKYLGHPGGSEEGDAVDVWAQQLDPDKAVVLSYKFINLPNTPPELLLVEKRA